MYKSDKMYYEMKSIEEQIKNIEIIDEESVVKFFKLYTDLIYNYKWIGSIYDIYDSNVLVFKGNGNKLNGAREVLEETIQLLAAFPDLNLTMGDIFAVPDARGYKLYRRFYLNGTNLGYSEYGKPTGKQLDGSKSICQSMSIIEKVNGSYRITYEYTMFPDEWIMNICSE